MRKLPFKAGQEAESKSFIDGYRGAWFRCKIRVISKRKKILGHISEYFDYPDEKLEWEKLYETPPFMLNAKEKHRELMLRPRYPPIYHEMPTANDVLEVIVIVSGSWMVGDLVDWWSADCYWSGRITEVFNDKEAQIELKPPPLGEGSSYRVLFKDLRPSLDWSPELGWTMPIKEGDSGQACARLIKPINEDVSSGAASRRSMLSKDGIENKQGHGYNKTRKTKRAKDGPRKIVVEQELEDVKDEFTFENCTLSGVARYSKRSCTIEETILDFEEYINKIKWLRNILKYGSSSSENRVRQWMFLEPSAASGTQ